MPAFEGLTGQRQTQRMAVQYGKGWDGRKSACCCGENRGQTFFVFWWVKKGIWKKKQSQLKPVFSPFPWESADHRAIPSSIHLVSRFEKPLSALYWGAGMGTEGHRDFWSLI